MTIKKSLIALAVSSAVVAPASVQAAEVYGTFGVQLQSSSTNNAGAPSTGYFFNRNSEDAGVTMFDGYESRFGVRGSEDMGNGLSAMYRLELGTNFDGINNEGSDIDIRLGYVGLSGDFGTVKAGTIWSVLYEYSGWNVWRTPSNGSFTYNYLTGSTGMDDVGGGLRVDNAVQYTYGGGGYGSDPFTFSVELGFEDDNVTQGSDNDTASGNDEETIDHISVGAQSTFGNFTVNGLVYTESNSNTAAGASVREPTLISLGGRFAAGPAWVGASFISVDRDDAAGTEPSGIQVTGGYDFGGGWSVTGAFGNADGDNFSADIDSAIFVHLNKALSDRTSLYADVETVELSDDTGATVFSTGMQHSF